MRSVPGGSTASPFYTLSPTLPPGFGLVGPPHLPGIPFTKDRAPFHLANLSKHPLLHVQGVQQAGGGMHQGIARRGGLAKDRAPELVRRDEPSTGTLPSNAILRFEKTTHAYHFQRPKMSRTRWVALL